MMAWTLARVPGAGVPGGSAEDLDVESASASEVSRPSRGRFAFAAFARSLSDRDAAKAPFAGRSHEATACAAAATRAAVVPHRHRRAAALRRPPASDIARRWRFGVPQPA